MSWSILSGDCLERLADLDDDSIDAVVTDPPYGISFMGKEWDGPAGMLGQMATGKEQRGAFAYGGTHSRGYADNDNRAFQVWTEAWATELLRVLKPGGHLLAFGGTRTYHRLASGIEDAGFEIRDSLSWQHLDHVFCQCGSVPYNHQDLSRKEVSGMRSEVETKGPVSGEPQQDLREEVRECRNCEGADGTDQTKHEGPCEVCGVRETDTGLSEDNQAQQESNVLSELQREGSREGVGETRLEGPGRVDGREQGELPGENERRQQSGLEGRSDLLPKEGQLSDDQVRSGAGVGEADGSERRLHNGASTSNGETGRPAAQQDRSGPPPRPRSYEQRSDEPGALAVEWIAQGGGVWPGCGGCGKPLAPPFDAGPLAWAYGSGFPKSLDVSKAIDKAAGAEREVVGRGVSWNRPDSEDGDTARMNASPGEYNLTAPATDLARQWQGWGTALKPAFEPIILARKPLIGTVAENVTRFGTGALNVDGCRVGLADGEKPYKYPNGNGGNKGPVAFIPHNEYNEKPLAGNPSGRWPANLVLDDQAAAMLDEQSGELVSGGDPKRRYGNAGRTVYGEYQPHINENATLGPNTGGASRFFYQAKASRAERNAGLDGFEERKAEWDHWVASGHNPGGVSAPRRNQHPTVKPVDLMRWLVRLVTPPGGTVLDPFTGSGTTGIAAGLEGFDFVGIEREADYREIAEARLKWWAKQEGETAEILHRAGLAEKERERAERVGQASLFDEDAA